MDEEIQKQLIEQFKLESLPEKDREEAVIRISNIIFRGALLRAMDGMDDAAAEELEKTIESHPDDLPTLLGFLESKVPNFAELLKSEVERFRRDIPE